MDPITATMNMITGLVKLSQDVFDAMPPELRTQTAGDFAKFNHNVSTFLVTIQDRINAALGNVPVPKA